MPLPISNPHKPAPDPSAHTVVVSHIWLIKAISFTILAALICGYLTLCFIFYQGQWQLVLHPRRLTTKSRAVEGSWIHFAPDESATPQLVGRWIPAVSGARYASATILFLPGGDGSLTDFEPTLDQLHSIGVNVFAFDYRGYGFSADAHPSQQRMIEDSDSAWTYLNTSRSLSAQQIIPYGVGVGASLATRLAAIHPDIPALILESPMTDLLDKVLGDQRTSLLPARMLFHELFPLAGPLATLHTPKLLLTTSTSPNKAFETAATPKVTVELASSLQGSYDKTLIRFLDQYLPQARSAQIVPTPTPSDTNPR